jgi:hypothetical protein
MHLRALSLNLQEAQFTFLRSLVAYISSLQAKSKGPKRSRALPRYAGPAAANYALACIGFICWAANCPSGCRETMALLALGAGADTILASHCFGATWSACLRLPGNPAQSKSAPSRLHPHPPPPPPSLLA